MTDFTAAKGPSVPGAKRCPKVILEGTRMTFKTDLAPALNDHPA